MSYFELKFQNLLRQHVDLRVLLVDFLGQFLELSSLTRDRVRTRGKALGQDGGTRESCQNQRP